MVKRCGVEPFGIQTLNSSDTLMWDVGAYDPSSPIISRTPSDIYPFPLGLLYFFFDPVAQTFCLCEQESHDHWHVPRPCQKPLEEPWSTISIQRLVNVQCDWLR